MIRGVLAQCAVTDLTRAEEWYTRLLEVSPTRARCPVCSSGVLATLSECRCGLNPIAPEKAASFWRRPTSAQPPRAWSPPASNTTAHNLVAEPKFCNSATPMATAWSSPESETRLPQESRARHHGRH